MTAFLLSLSVLTPSFHYHLHVGIRQAAKITFLTLSCATKNLPYLENQIGGFLSKKAHINAIKILKKKEPNMIVESLSYYSSSS